VLTLVSPWLVQFCLLLTRGLRSSWFGLDIKGAPIGFEGRASCVTYGMLVYRGELLNFLNRIFLTIAYMLLLLMGFLHQYPFQQVFLRVVYGHLCFLIYTPA